MRLAVVLEQCLSPVPGGTGRYSREIAVALARTTGPQDEVAGVVAWHRDTGAARVPGVRGPHRLPLPRRALVAAWERGRGPRVRADVVLAPTPLWPGPGGPPSVVVVHDAVPWTHPETLTARGARWHRRVVTSAARSAALVVVPTSAVADELARHLPLREVLVVGEGVSSELAVPSDARLRAARLALPDRFLLTVATLEPRKGLDVLLQALAEPSAPDLPLLCAGQPGWGGQDPRALAAAAGLPAERVRLLGRVDDADLAVLLDRATAVVVPSRAEGFGLPVLEAMAAGTPVVTSDAPALVEVGGGATRVSPLVPAELATALHEVVSDADVRGRMAAAGRARAGAFSWGAAAERLWAAVRAVHSGRPAV
ncbi:MAG: Glycosyl transferase, group 1 [uncultured Frankineae bacterium]|uniref:Glycosyl transferase, group 1 n=1 Tax=uncultured Frankineae bacterium TaxID=437475 RepID=A0A6J4KJP6_9ACTN|nr:MAG: Glycosyl transferase, group 1 [uncultured Frankineae bacterium]